MSIGQFYEKYWQSPEVEPDRGQLVQVRKVRLKDELKRIPTGAKVADLGCGIGVFTNYFSSLGYDSTGVDISNQSIDHARNRYPRLRFEVAPLGPGLPFADKEFDVLWCSEVLEHLFDIDSALTEMYRILQPGGLVLITCPYHGLTKNLLIALSSFDKHYAPTEGHIRFFSRNTLRRCLELSGFRVRSMSGIGRFWPLYMSHFVVAQKI